MGAGLALLFKKEFPGYFKDYSNKCKIGSIKIGKVDIYKTEKFFPSYILSFPTKNHWKDRSNLEDIEKGLLSLKEVIILHNIKSIAIPCIECGLGGLNKEDVKLLIYRHLDFIDRLVILYDYKK